MEEWLSKDFVMSFENKNQKDYRKPLVLEPKFSEKPSRPSQSLIYEPLYKKLNEIKDEIKSCSDWKKWSQLTNPYEKVNKIANGVESRGRSNNHAQVMNRDFFKMIEILKFFENYLPETETEFKSAHVCEAPGSFIKAVLKNKPRCEWYAQTLYEGSYSLKIDPVLNDSERWIKDGDSTGNLYSIKNIKAFSDKVFSKIGKVDLVTADGSFDVSYDPNNQEQLSSQLIFSEIVAALHCQNVSGMFVCKIFDTNTKPSSQLLYLLTNYYEKLFLIKPRNSKYSNSEKYIVATNFKGISDEDLGILDSLVEKWSESSDNHHPFCRDLGIDQSDSFKKVLSDFNKKMSKNQMKYIKDSLNGSSWNPGYSRYLEAFQNKRASEFCEAFGIGSNVHPQLCKHLSIKSIGSGIKKCDKCLKLLI